MAIPGSGLITGMGVTLRNLHVEAKDGTVVLRGQVGSFYEKQLGHQCCRRVAGVQKLIDSIDVVSMTAAAAVA